MLDHTDINTPASQQTYREWKSWALENFGTCPLVEARYFQVEFSRAGVPLRRNLPVLEIGFGNGAFAAWASARGYDYSGTELDSELVARARKHGWRVFDATLAIDTLELPTPPKCIVAFDVLEHLPVDQIIELLTAARRVLASGGCVVARLPSGDSPFARYIQHGDITHRSTIGSSAMRQIAATVGLHVEQLRSPSFPLTGIGLRRWFRRVPVALSRAITNRWVHAVFHDSKPTILTSNMLVVLRKRDDTSVEESSGDSIVG